MSCLAVALALVSSAQSTPWSDVTPLAGRTTWGEALDSADLNGDGLEDLLIISLRPARVSVALASGPGTFMPSEVQSTAIEQTVLNLGSVRHRLVDLNADGALDVVVLTRALTGGGRVLSFIGDGDGGFAPPTVLYVSSSPLNTVDAADLNGDGYSEVILSGQGGNLGYLEGSAAGPIPLTLLRLVAGANIGNSAEVADFDGDGFPDLVAQVRSNQGNGITEVMFGDGTLPFVRTGALVLDITPLDYFTEDFDGDGDLDIAGTASNGSTIFTLENLGARQFGPLGLIFATSNFAEVGVADLDGDGLPDFVNFDGFIDTRYVRNLGGMQFSGPLVLTSQLSDGFTAFDVTGDGTVEFFSMIRQADLSETSVQFFLGNVTAAGFFELGPRTILSEDLDDPLGFPLRGNNDAWDDLLVVARSTGKIVWKESLGNGQFGAQRRLGTTVANQRTVAVGDFTGDGVDDVVFQDSAATDFLIREGVGNGLFAQEATLVAGTFPAAEFHAEDLDGDGRLDLLWLSASESAINYAFGEPGGGLGPVRSLVGGSLPVATTVAIADLDGDGRQELLLRSGRVLATSTLSPGLTFGAPITINSDLPGTFVAPVTPADLDGDGVVDVAFNDDAEELSWLRGLGGGAFASPAKLIPQFVNSGARAADFDLDGDLDLLVSWRDTFSSFVPLLGWAENQGAAGFAPIAAVAPTSPEPIRGRPVLLDFDGDQDFDLIGMAMPNSSGAARTAYSVENSVLGELGTLICAAAVPNSTGEVGGIGAAGSSDLSLNALVLNASSLPANAFGYFLCSQDPGSVTGVPGSSGTLCLGGSIGRFNLSGEIQQADGGGSFALTLDLTSIPTPNMGRIPIAAGETWFFQAWHRDTLMGGGATSNFTDALRVEF